MGRGCACIWRATTQRLTGAGPRRRVTIQERMRARNSATFDRPRAAADTLGSRSAEGSTPGGQHAAGIQPSSRRFIMQSAVHRLQEQQRQRRASDATTQAPCKKPRWPGRAERNACDKSTCSLFCSWSQAVRLHCRWEGGGARCI